MQTTPTAPAPVSQSLLTLNTHRFGDIGLGVGALSFVGIAASVKNVFDHLSDGGFLRALAFEHGAHQFGPATSTLDGSLVGIGGSLTALAFAVLAAYLGKPKTVPCS